LLVPQARWALQPAQQGAARRPATIRAGLPSTKSAQGLPLAWGATRLGLLPALRALAWPPTRLPLPAALRVPTSQTT
jgi:hypothetical protein